MDETGLSATIQRLERSVRLFQYIAVIASIVAVSALAVSVAALAPWLKIRAALNEGAMLERNSANGSGASVPPIAQATASPSAVKIQNPEPKLLASLGITVTGKRTLPKNPEADQFSDEVELTLRADNLFARKIRAYEGRLEVGDLLGNEIIGLNLINQEPIAAGNSAQFTRYWEMNQFENSNTRFEAEDFANLRFQWQPAKIIFADGTTAEASEVEHLAR